MIDSFHLECPACGAAGVWARFEEGTVVDCPDECGAKVVLSHSFGRFSPNKFLDERDI